MHNALASAFRELMYIKNRPNKIQMSTGPYQHCVLPLHQLFDSESNSENVGKREIHVRVDTSSHAAVLKS